MEVVRKLIGGKDANTNRDAEVTKEPGKVEESGKDKTKAQGSEQSAAAHGDEAKADVAAEVADSAQKLDAEVEA